MILGTVHNGGVPLILFIVELGPAVLAVCAGGSSLDVFSLLRLLLLSPSPETVGYRLKYWLQGQLNLRQQTKGSNQ